MYALEHVAESDAVTELQAAISVLDMAALKTAISGRAQLPGAGPRAVLL